MCVPMLLCVRLCYACIHTLVYWRAEQRRWEGGRKMGVSAISDSDAVKKLGCLLYLDNWRANHILRNSRGEMVRWLINDGIHQHR